MLKKLNDAMDYIEAHLEDEFLLEKISEHINVSDYHFRKIFFALTNMTLNEYVKNRRLSEANKELLQGAQVTDVAYQYGYQSVDGFTRAFKKWSGILPSQVAKLKQCKSCQKLQFVVTMKGGTLMEYKIVEKPAFTFAGVSKRVPLQYEGVNNAILELAQSITQEQKNNLSGWAKHMIETVKTEVNYTLTAQLLKELSGKEETSELLAIIEMREDRLENVALSSNPFIVLFDRPSNKGNLGTMIRSCDALGVDMLIITGHAVDLYEPDVIVSAMGSFFNLPVIRIIHNEDLYKFVESLRIKYPGFKIIGTTAHHEKPIYHEDLKTPVMLMMGNETMGLNKAFKEYCDVLCTIPMAEDSYASSFNVSCAASIMMYEIVRQRMN